MLRLSDSEGETPNERSEFLGGAGDVFRIGENLVKL